MNEIITFKFQILIEGLISYIKLYVPIVGANFHITDIYNLK